MTAVEDDARLMQRPESDNWVNLVALPSKGWGSVSVKKLHAVTKTLGVDPAETDISVLFDDLGATWYVVMVPPDAIPEETTLARIAQLAETVRDENRAVRRREAPPDRPPADPLAAPALPASRSCPTCARTLETSAMVERHLTIDHGESAHRCADCGWVFESKSGLGRHRHSAHGDQGAPESSRFCGECGREFASAEIARHHEDTLHADEAVAVCCPDCGWTFDSEAGLAHHRILKHSDDEERPRYPRKERQIVLACSEPACHFTAQYAADMNSHTMSAHSRRATKAERTPVTEEEKSA